jgi:ADP-heptose:LPS heptosyltransferase
LIAIMKRTAFRGIAATERTLRLFGEGSPSLDPADLRRIRNFLIPQVHPFLGAAVHETPLIEALRSAVPEARIVAVGEGIGVEVLRNHPGISRIEPAPDPHQDFRGAVRSYRRVVRSFGRDPWCALFTGWNGRSRVLLATMLAGNGVRTGFAVAPELAHLPLIYDRHKSQIANTLRIPGLLGHAAPSDLEPRVYFTVEDLHAARHLLGGQETSRAGPLAIFVTQTRQGQRKQWRQERFVAVARWLIREHGCRIALVGAASESPAVEALQSAIGPNAFSLAGHTSISVLTAVLAQADIALTLDTGILHLIRAAGLPACTVTPAWSPPHEWLPLGNARFRILKNLDLATQPAGYIIDEVSVDEVCSALGDLLREYPASAAGRDARLQRALAGNLPSISAKGVLEGMRG